MYSSPWKILSQKPVYNSLRECYFNFGQLKLEIDCLPSEKSFAVSELMDSLSQLSKPKASGRVLIHGASSLKTQVVCSVTCQTGPVLKLL